MKTTKPCRCTTSRPRNDLTWRLIQRGLAKLRQPWIAARNDSEELDDRSSAYTKERLADDGLDELRFSSLLTPKTPTGKRVTSALHYARRGSSPEMGLSPSVKMWPRAYS
ncbi:hypothetical protein [Citrobacter freundii]|uniref:hypothetical protein n=1 Tax=Citrobacter freundii TaxID=546 RepID=UPI00388D5F42